MFAILSLFNKNIRPFIYLYVFTLILFLQTFFNSKKKI